MRLMLRVLRFLRVRVRRRRKVGSVMSEFLLSSTLFGIAYLTYLLGFMPKVLLDERPLLTVLASLWQRGCL